jgi:hypothetical protein
MSVSRAALCVSVLSLFVALGGGAMALQGKNSVDSGDIKNGTLKSKDIGDGTIQGKDVKGNTLKAGDIDETSLAGLQAGNGETDVTGGTDVPLFESATLAETPLGTIELACSGAPTIAYTNGSGEGVTLFATTRELVFEDDGVAGNGAVAIARETVNDGSTANVGLSGAGGLGSSEAALLGATDVVIAEVRAFADPNGCDYVARIEQGPAN